MSNVIRRIMFVHSNNPVVWVQPNAGSVGTFDGGQLISVPLEATGVAPVSYAITPALPDAPDLTITGSTLTGWFPVGVFDASDMPSWVSPPAGSLGDFKEYEAITPIDLVVTPVAGRTIASMFTLSGVLPPGLVLTGSTITGTLAEAYGDSQPPAPTTWVSPPQGSLGTVPLGGSLSATLSATGNGAVSYLLVAGALPPATVLDGASGVISGTPDITKVPGSNYTYSFTIRATDAAGGYSDRAFSVTLARDSTKSLMHFELSLADEKGLGYVGQPVSPDTFTQLSAAFGYGFHVLADTNPSPGGVVGIWSQHSFALGPQFTISSRWYKPSSPDSFALPLVCFGDRKSGNPEGVELHLVYDSALGQARLALKYGAVGSGYRYTTPAIAFTHYNNIHYEMVVDGTTVYLFVAGTLVGTHSMVGYSSPTSGAILSLGVGEDKFTESPTGLALVSEFYARSGVAHTVSFAPPTLPYTGV